MILSRCFSDQTLSDQEIDERINKYLDREQLRLSPAQYQSLREAAKEWNRTPTRLPTHPYGGQMKEGDERHSPRNRAQIKGGLYLYFDNGRPINEPYRGTPRILQEDDIGGALADQINQRRDAKIGLELSDRLVSRTELGSALQMQLYTYPEQYRLLDQRYRELKSIEEICAAGHFEERTYYNRLTAAVDTLIDVIYTVDFTEAKSQDMSK